FICQHFCSTSTSSTSIYILSLHDAFRSHSFIGEEPFAVLLGDDIVVSEEPCIKQLMDVYEQYQTSVVGVLTVPYEDVSKYGIITDRKSTRLNSSHVSISYAVFCL